MYESLLPVGSVVLLKGANKRVMVIGRIQVMKGDPTVYDYVSCPYPEGLIDADELYFFNRDDIERVYFIGFQDPEELQFRAERLAPLSELYVDEDGQIAERAAGPEAAAPAPDPNVIEPVVFADV